MLEGGETHVYSRNSENNTSKYPDIIARMPKVCTYIDVVLCVCVRPSPFTFTSHLTFVPFLPMTF